MGDPAGIGPEIILKAFLKTNLFKESIPLVIGDEGVMRYYSELFKIPLRIVPVKRDDILSLEPLSDGLYVLSLSDLTFRLIPGRSDAECGRASVEYIKEATYLAMDEKIAAIVTAPISKASIHAAGYSYPGHTELLAELTQTDDFAMMLVGDKLRVSLVTIHVALKEVPTLLTEDKIYRVGRLTYKALTEWFGINYPNIAVCALNPHAGEKGAFGDEEGRIISPAIDKLKKDGYPVSGPFSPDTVFYRALKGEFDAVVAMYHDQGLIPLKLHAFDRGVNLTLGLPIIRTSVDHGTAFEIAGEGVANPQSFICAYELALLLSQKRSRIKKCES